MSKEKAAYLGGVFAVNQKYGGYMKNVKTDRNLRLKNFYQK